MVDQKTFCTIAMKYCTQQSRESRVV
uniref:Uncharacterized protein n=1 Tax=Rhizophora mucronata TaxID=61149 RepID=A0A2P2N7N0_RHIMU